MTIKKTIIGACMLAGISVAGTGCRKYLDVNTNPNVAQDAGPEFLLPSAQISLASAMGVDLQINGGIWGQYWTQAPSSSQYKNYEQYSPTASTYDRVWSLLYSDELEDLDQMEKKARAANQVFYIGISQLMKAYTYQVITDGWGDVPYSESLKGKAEDGGIVSPHFDAQSNVYDGIIALARQGMATLAPLAASSTVTGDLIFSGNLSSWRKFGNTLLLKMYLRLADKAPAKAQAGIASLSATAGYIDEMSGDAQIVYSSTAGNQNPLYSEIVGLSRVQNLVGSATSLDSLSRGNPGQPFDARTYYFFDPASTGYVGLTQGLYTASPSTPVSIPSANTGANAQNAASALAPVKFFTTYESKFLQAEAAARGWSAGNDSMLFIDGITLSFNEAAGSIPTDIVLRDSFATSPDAATDVLTLTPDYALYRYLHGDTLSGYLEGDEVENEDPSYWAQYPRNGSVQQKVRHIITQKWFSMTGTQGFEAWTEWRRTGYPAWFHLSEHSLLPKTPGNFPHRLLYPDVEVQRNQNFPGQKMVTDRVYWDIH